MYILVDDEHRENEGIGHFVARCSKKGFMAKHGRGLTCLALDPVLPKLDLNLWLPLISHVIKLPLQYL